MSAVTIIDYKMGNLRSIANAMRLVGADVRLARTGDELRGADRVILPGVGAFGASVRNLRETGLDEAIHTHVAAERPFFGICLGFQVMFERGSELGDHVGLGLMEGSVDIFETRLHVPHVGWNRLAPTQAHPLWADLPDDPHMYFVHSFRPTGVEPEHVIGTAEYDGDFVCAVANGATAGVQFHPEKSGGDGLRVLSNFLRWSP